MNNLGCARCDYCGATFRLFTIFNKDMQGLCKAWKRRHEHGCKHKTPEQRRKWARPYVGKNEMDSSIVVDLTHPGFQSETEHPVNNNPKRTSDDFCS